LTLAVVGVVITSGAGYWAQRARKRHGETKADALARAGRVGLWSVLTGLMGYVLYGVGAPGSDLVRAALGAWSALLVAVICGAIPVIAGLRAAGVKR
jgi:hypothetical protein